MGDELLSQTSPRPTSSHVTSLSSVANSMEPIAEAMTSSSDSTRDTTLSAEPATGNGSQSSNASNNSITSSNSAGHKASTVEAIPKGSDQEKDSKTTSNSTSTISNCLGDSSSRTIDNSIGKISCNSVESAKTTPSCMSIADALPTTAATAAAAAPGRITSNIQPIQPIVNRRIPHLHKLEKKQSSGDLLSRLKTRKILGVGETDDGDVHRSKLSQILGHSDQLYIRLPYGLRLWQLLLAIMFSSIGVWALLFPYHLYHTTLDKPVTDLVALPIRLYGGALVCLSVVFWSAIRCQDREIIRMTLLISIMYFVLQFLVTGWHLMMEMALPGNALRLMVCRLIFALTSWSYNHLLANRRWNGNAK